MPLANHISGPIKNRQSEQSNSSNMTMWTSTSDNNVTIMVENQYKHLQIFSTLVGSKYPSQSDVNFDGSILNSVEYYNSFENNSTNESCHNSHLGSVVGKNSIKRIPTRVWLTISWILTMSSIGRFV